MTLSVPTSHRLRKPVDEGYRTPTVEDPSHPANSSEQSRRNLLTSSPAHIFDSFQLAHLHSRTQRSATGTGKVTRSSTEQTDESDEKLTTLPWKRRLKHVTWAYFTITMATGGIANVVSNVPYRFPGLQTIGLIFFFLNIVCYIAIWALIITRFTLFPQTFKASFTHPTESLFVPAFAVSFGTILINVVEYGFGQVGTWLNGAVLVLFWLDTAMAIVLSVSIYMILWSTLSFTIARMTPIWIFPAYPLLIIGPHASNLAARLPSHSQALPVIIGGFTVQGIGFLVSLTIYSAFVYRLMTQKLPAESLRPGMFVSVGPSAFTVSGTIGMASNLPRVLSHYNTYMSMPSALAAQVLRLVANWMSLWLWGLAFWFFFVSVVANLAGLRHKHKVPFTMTWFSFIFPQTALTTATFKVGEAFENSAIKWLGCVMTVLLIILWGFVMFMMVRAVIQKQILWPGKGEDRTEGGFGQKEGPGLDEQKTNDLEDQRRAMATSEKQEGV